jgi:hypothetical protein
MSQSEYLSFYQCRLTNFLSRGRHLICEWLQLQQERVDPKDLEVFSYILRVILSRIVD